MARGGINLVLVRKAREALLARGQNPSIDAIRIELGNTGSKTTIQRYLKEIDAHDPRPAASPSRLSEELSGMVAKMLGPARRKQSLVNLPWQSRLTSLASGAASQVLPWLPGDDLDQL